MKVLVVDGQEIKGLTNPSGGLTNPSGRTKLHDWEVVKMSDGKRFKRCRLCWYAYEFGHDLSCPALVATDKARQ